MFKSVSIYHEICIKIEVEINGQINDNRACIQWHRKWSSGSTSPPLRTGLNSTTLSTHTKNSKIFSLFPRILRQLLMWPHVASQKAPNSTRWIKSYLDCDFSHDTKTDKLCRIHFLLFQIFYVKECIFALLFLFASCFLLFEWILNTFVSYSNNTNILYKVNCSRSKKRQNQSS